MAAFGTAGSVVLLGALLSREHVPEAGALEIVYAHAPERVEVRALAPGLTFGQILIEAGLDANDRNNLLLAFREHANPRRMSPGTAVRIRWRGEPERLHGVEVGLDRDRTVLLDRAGSGWLSSTVTLPTTTDTIFVAGEINTSLWNSVTDHVQLGHVPANDRVELVNRLDRVFQWQVDFSRQIRVGDTYRFAFEREKRPDGTMRRGELLSAELVNAGRSYHAIWFDPNGDGRGTWYDLDGESVRRAFLKKPLKLSRISSRFSNSRFHPILRRWRAHRGVDYAANSGAPVEVTGNGVVTRRNWNDTYGRVIDVRHPNGFLTRYAHLSGWASGIAVGSRVVQGQVIGYVGMTGLATAPHVHYEMHTAGRPVDPLAIDLPAGDPVPADDRDRWEREMAERLAMLLRPPGPETFRGRRAAVTGVDSGC